jgi:hypothetical protein
MSDFNVEKALREEISGLLEIKETLGKRQHILQIQYGELEIELNHVNKLVGFCKIELDRMRIELEKVTQ